MDLAEVRRMLTTGYERINNMKTSTAKVEICRAKLKIKREKLHQDIKFMMNCTAEKLHQLQLHMETSVKEEVARRETLLDAKKKEIHDGYAKLVQVCVEADKVLRGRNDDLLGRSCQRLFNNFDAAKFKLDAAERIDTEGMTGFEFQSNSEQFLTSTFLAKLQFFDRSHKPLEAEEFWVQMPKSQTAVPPLGTRHILPAQFSDYGDYFHKSFTSASTPDRSFSESPKQLESIDEVPEDNVANVRRNISTKSKPESAVELVHIREVDLCVNQEFESDIKVQSTKRSIVFDNDIPPPPGFSKLDMPDIGDNDMPELENVSTGSRCRQKTQRRSTNPLPSPYMSSDAPSPGHYTETQLAGDFKGDLYSPDPEACSALCGQNTGSSFSVPGYTIDSPTHILNEGTTYAEVIVRPTATKRTPDDGDFVWDSDDSADIPNLQTGSGELLSGPVTENNLPSVDKEVSPKEKTTNSAFSAVNQSTRSKFSPYPISSGSKRQELRTSDPVVPSGLLDVTQYVYKSKLGSSDVSHDSSKTNQTGTAFSASSSRSPDEKAQSNLAQSMKPAVGNPKGFPGSPNSKNVALKTFEHSSISQTPALGSTKPPSLPAAPDINIVVGKSMDKHQPTIKKEPGEDVLDKYHPKTKEPEYSVVEKHHSIKKEQGGEVLDRQHPLVKKEQENTVKEEQCKDVLQERKTLQDHRQHKDREIAATANVARKTESVKGPSATALSKPCEVPRLIKHRKKFLDLSHMMDNVGGSYNEISAKCVEKIRGDFEHPIGICTNSKGHVIVADTGNNIIKVCNNGRVVNKFGADQRMRRPSAVVVNDKDEVFVKDDHCLYHFDADGNFIKTLGKKMMNTPYGLGMTKDGRLVVVDALYSNARLHIFEQNGAIDTFPFEPLRSRYDDSKCRFVATHGEEVLVCDLGRSCLYLTNLKGELSKTLGRRGKRPGEVNEPAGVAADNAGNWVVADSKNHRVQVFAPNGYYMATLQFQGETIRRPSGIHLTSDGLLYIINYVESIIKVFKLGSTS